MSQFLHAAESYLRATGQCPIRSDGKLTLAISLGGEACNMRLVVPDAKPTIGQVILTAGRFAISNHADASVNDTAMALDAACWHGTVSYDHRAKSVETSSFIFLDGVQVTHRHIERLIDYASIRMLIMLNTIGQIQLARRIMARVATNMRIARLLFPAR